MRFGYTAVLGFLPLIGGSIDLILSYLLIIQKVRQLEIDVPPLVVRKMVMNTLIGTGVGIVFPLVGDVFMAVYKPNSRNALLLEKTLRNKLGKVRVEGSSTEINHRDQEKKTKEKASWNLKGLPRFRRSGKSNEVSVTK